MIRRLQFGIVVGASLYMLFSPDSGVPVFPDIWILNDKLIHASMFALLAVTGRRADVPVRWLAPALIAYAAGSEVLQAILPIHRDGDPWDFVADCSGIAVGLLLAGWLRGRRGASRTDEPGTRVPSRTPGS